MGSRNKKGIARFEASKATGNEGRPHGGGSGTGISAPISRRGLFAALAVAAGLGILSSTQAYALAAQNFGRGQWIGNKWVNGHISGVITHPHPDRGVNDYFFGKSTNNGAWNATANGSQKLIAEFACVVECDWSDELYDHIVFRPFYYCASLNPNGRPLWFGSEDGDDNRSYVFLNDNPVGTFQGNLINSGWSTGWLANGFYEGPGCDTFVRRQAKPHDEKVKARMDIWNVWVNGVPANKNPNDIKGQRFAPNNDMAINVEKIYLENDMSLMGGIFKIIPVCAPEMRLDLCQGVKDSNNNAIASYENGRQVVIWTDYEGVNQNWMMKPNKYDGMGTFTFCVANMLGHGLDRGLDNRGHTAPTMDRGHAEIWRNPESANLTNSWWVHHEPSVTNETDHKCWFFTSDADGQRLDLWSTGKGANPQVYSAACPGRWGQQAGAQWMLEEACCHGSVALSQDLMKAGETVEIQGWHNRIGDDTQMILPLGYIRDSVNESSLPVYPIFRLYMTDVEAEVTDDPDAVIMASCGVVTWDSKQLECPSHRHIGWPHGGHSIHNLEMRLEGSKFPGSIHYAARPQAGGEWIEGSDGVRILESSSSPIAQVKIWLEGEVSKHYDLCYRAFVGGLGWMGPYYSNSGTAEGAPAAGANITSGDESAQTGWFEFRTPSGLCLDVYDGGNKGNVNGQNVELWTTNSTIAQQFLVQETASGTTYIANTYGWLIDVYSNHNVQIWQSNDGLGPRWMIEETEGGVLVRSQWTGGLMTYASDTKGANVSCEAERADHAGQVWSMVGVPARSEGLTGKIAGLNVHLIRKPENGRVVREFSGDEDFVVDESWGSGYIYAAAMLGIRTVPFTDVTVWTDRYKGTVVSKPSKVESVCVEYYADGIDAKHLVYRDSNVHSGDAYAPAEAALEAAGRKPCNLDAHFGEDSASGFTGWFKDAALVDPATSLSIPDKGALKLYGRNRCTLRIEYAEGSVELDAGTVFRKSPSDKAEVVDGALGLVDFTGRVEKHRLDSIDLPAIGDDGVAHASFYRGESVTLAGSADVFTKLEDGTWRRLVFKGYMSDKAGGVASHDNQDGTRYDRICRMGVCGVGRRRHGKEVITNRDGGASSVPRPRMSLAGGARR
ncbi:MAG: RICIN domain-containing protein [Collinsella sp.]